MLHNALEVSGFLGTGLLYDVDAALKANKEWAQRKQHVPATTLAGHTWQGRLVSLPAITSAIAVFYNKELLRQSSLPEPGAGWTWDAFVDMTRKVKQATGKWGCSFPPAGNTGPSTGTTGGRNNVALVDVQRARSNVTSPDALDVTRFLEDVVVQLFALANITRDEKASPAGRDAVRLGPAAAGSNAVAGHAADLGRAQARRRRGADAQPQAVVQLRHPGPRHRVQRRQRTAASGGAAVRAVDRQAGDAGAVRHADQTATRSTPTPAGCRPSSSTSRPTPAWRCSRAQSQVRALRLLPRNGEAYDVMGKYVAEVLQGEEGLPQHTPSDRRIQVRAGRGLEEVGHPDARSALQPLTVCPWSAAHPRHDHQQIFPSATGA